MNSTDRKWIDALKAHLGNGKGLVPFYELSNGDVDAKATIARFVQMIVPAPEGTGYPKCVCDGDW